MRKVLWACCILVSIVTPALTALGRPLRSFAVPQSGATLSRRVPSFQGQGLCLVDALLKLGQQEQIPLGIEYISREALEKPVGTDMDETTVGKIVQALLRGDKSYNWEVRGSVLNISHKTLPSGNANLLDRVLPEFAIPQCSVAEASNVLYMTLDQQLHPWVKGYAGEYNPGDLQNRVGPFQLRNATVREILNRLVSGASKSAAWIVRVPADHLGELPTHGFWTIIEYESPPRQYAGDLLRQVFGQ